MTQNERRLFLIQSLLKEKPEYRNISIPDSANAQQQLLRALMNVRIPAPISRELSAIQDEYLQAEIAAKGITGDEQILYSIFIISFKKTQGNKKCVITKIAPHLMVQRYFGGEGGI